MGDDPNTPRGAAEPPGPSVPDGADSADGTGWEAIYAAMPLKTYFHRVYRTWRSSSASEAWASEQHVWPPILVGLGDRRLGDLGASDVQAFLDGLFAISGPHQGRDPARARRLHLEALQILLERAFRLRHISRLPQIRDAGVRRAQSGSPLTAFPPTLQPDRDLERTDPSPLSRESAATVPITPLARSELTRLAEEAKARKPPVGDDDGPTAPRITRPLPDRADTIRRLTITERQKSGVHISFELRDGRKRSAWVPSGAERQATPDAQRQVSPTDGGPPLGPAAAARHGSLVSGPVEELEEVSLGEDGATEILVRPPLAGPGQPPPDPDAEKTWVARIDYDTLRQMAEARKAANRLDEATMEAAAADPDELPTLGAVPIPNVRAVDEGDDGGGNGADNGADNGRDDVEVRRRRPDSEATIVKRGPSIPPPPRRAKVAPTTSPLAQASDADIVALGCFAGAGFLAVVVLGVALAAGWLTG